MAQPGSPSRSTMASMAASSSSLSGHPDAAAIRRDLIGSGHPGEDRGDAGLGGHPGDSEFEQRVTPVSGEVAEPLDGGESFR